jgi:imidazolonepropionase-like amidohydrolase
MTSEPKHSFRAHDRHRREVVRARDALLPCVLSLALAAGAGTAAARASDIIPGAPQERPILLRGGTVHPIVGDDFVGDVLFAEGKITDLGTNVRAPENAELVDVRGKHVYPGLIDASTDLGLTEIDSVRATRDRSETGDVNPNVRAQVAINPDSELIPVARRNGILAVLSSPSGGIVSGRSVLIALDGWTWEDMTIRADVALHVEWPSAAPIDDWLLPGDARERLRSRDEALTHLHRLFDEASARSSAGRAAALGMSHDLRIDALAPVLTGELPIVARADTLGEIEAAIGFAAQRGLRLIIEGGYDAPECAVLLRERSIPVVVAGVYRLPRRRSDAYDAAYTLPARLHAAGVEYAISSASPGSDGASNIRNLPYHAATAAAFGLSREEALRAITIHPARILGVADRIGSLERGKDATLFISNGDPLETATNVEAAYIAGRRVDLSNRHDRLYEKYLEKYRRSGAIPR